MKKVFGHITVSGTTDSRNGNGIFCFGRNISSLIGSCLNAGTKD
ncbi:MAG: hypothetical protein R3182_04605 [Draconibacterium sp.]|nr:hypothetical protein [Draconibacterium sp.]